MSYDAKDKLFAYSGVIASLIDAIDEASYPAAEARLLESISFFSSLLPGIVESVQAEPPKTQEEEAPPPPKKKRSSRKKKAEETPPPAPEPEPEPEPEQPTGEDLLDDTKPEIKVGADKTITKDDLQAVMRELLNKSKRDVIEKALAVRGAAKLGELKEADYQAVFVELTSSL